LGQNGPISIRRPVANNNFAAGRAAAVRKGARPTSIGQIGSIGLWPVNPPSGPDFFFEAGKRRVSLHFVKPARID